MTIAAAKSALETLLGPVDAETFLGRHWPERHLVVHGALDRLPDFPGIAERVTPLPRILAEGRERVRVWFALRDGRFADMEATPKVAENLFLAGSTSVGIDRVDEIIPELKRWIDALARELDSPMNASFAVLFASPKGMESRLHFDNREVFVLQVHGRKEWTIAPNRSLRNPPKTYVMGNPVFPEVRPPSGSFPAGTPADAETHVLSPGSFLFLPRGYWHATRALEDSTSFSINIVVKTWAELLQEHLRKTLPKDEAWREPAAGALGTVERYDAALRRFSALRDQLVRELESLDLGALLQAQALRPGTPGAAPGAFYRRNPAVAVSVRREADEEYVSIANGASGGELRIKSQFIPCVRWIEGLEGSAFGADDLARSQGLSIAAACQLLALLAEAGVVTAGER